MGTLVIVQARMGSTRLPGKVMKEVNGKPMIYWQLKRIEQSKMISSMVVATSTDAEDDILTEYLNTEGFSVYRGSALNVLERYSGVISEYSPKVCVRLTADCPLFMPEILDKMLIDFSSMEVDYYSNTIVPTFPDGLDIEIFRPESLLDLKKFELKDYEKEHVTIGLYMRPKTYSIRNYLDVKDESGQRWTVDYQEDLDFVREFYKYFEGRELSFNYVDACDFVREHPDSWSKIDPGRRDEALQRIGLGKIIK